MKIKVDNGLNLSVNEEFIKRFMASKNRTQLAHLKGILFNSGDILALRCLLISAILIFLCLMDKQTDGSIRIYRRFA